MPRPRWARRASVASIATGTALFVLASVLTSGADATPDAGPAAAAVADPAYVVTPVPLPASLPALRTPARAHSAPVKSVRHQAVTKAAVVSVSGLAANGIPTVALNAYRVAAARMDNADPGCGIDWALLAGIGRIESDHGRFAGAVLHTDGTSTPQIMGPALNGNGTALIPATSDTTALSGDPTYTRALGPMQFIPQTWAGYGADADGDGTANIFDIDDAALAAARYLCAAGGDVRTHDGAVRAVLAYNHVTSYVNAVLALADAYRRGIPISGVPIGNLSGDLPPVTKPTGAANPGGPTAVGGDDGNKHGTTDGQGWRWRVDAAHLVRLVVRGLVVRWLVVRWLVVRWLVVRWLVVGIVVPATEFVRLLAPAALVGFIASRRRRTRRRRTRRRPRTRRARRRLRRASSASEASASSRDRGLNRIVSGAVSTDVDSELVAPSAHHDFERWVAPHLPVLRAVARRWAGADAPDLVQETLLRAWRSRERFRSEDGTTRAWLLTILVNEIRREHGRRRPVPVADPHDIAVPSDDTTRLVVEAAVRGLSVRQQEAVVLYYFADLGVAEVATVLGVSTGTVKAHLAAARDRLRSLLEDR